MEEYLYIIVGVAALIFNIYRKAQKNKLKNAMPEDSQQEPEERKPFVPKNFPQDLLDELDNAFGNQSPKQEEKVEINEDVIEFNEASNFKNVNDLIENKEVETIIKPTIIEKIKTPNKKFKFNIKDAIIYNTILERKY